MLFQRLPTWGVRIEPYGDGLIIGFNSQGVGGVAVDDGDFEAAVAADEGAKVAAREI